MKAALATVMLMLAACHQAPTASSSTSPSSSTTSPPAPGGPTVPGATNPAVTPATLATTICTAGWTATVRPPQAWSEQVKRELAAGRPLAAYELDHAIPLELGGAPQDLANLWLQPWDGPAGAHAKDTGENRLHRLVCAGTMALPVAQQLVLDPGEWHS